MTSEQIEIINALTQVTILPGTWDKRFVRKVVELPAEKPLSVSQNEWLYRLLYKYRRQTPFVYKKYASNEFCCQKPARDAMKDKSNTVNLEQAAKNTQQSLNF